MVDYVTADEPLYLKQSANFLYLLKAKQFDQTDLIVHPGVPTLWSGALGFYIMFPDYLEDERSEFPVADLDFKRIIEDGGVNRKSMLAVSRLISISLQTLLLLLAFYFGQNVFGFWQSLFITLFVSFDPFYFANSRILQPDGMLTSSMYLALVACLSYLYSRSQIALLVSGAASGLAVLSKVPGLILIPLVVVLFLAFWWRGTYEDRRTKNSLMLLIKNYLIWLVMAFLVMFVLWPALWVEPLQAFSQLMAFTSEASAEVNSPMFFNGQVLPEGEFGLEYFYYYPLTFLWRTTPLVLIGFVFGFLSLLIKPDDKSFWKKYGFTALSFLLSALLIVVLFSLSMKKMDRYILPAMVYLDVVSAMGILALFSSLPWNLKFSREAFLPLLMVISVILQVVLVVQVYPYYHSYYNPLLGGLEKAQDVMMVGWGEGLNEAGEYLNSRPANTKYMKVFAWYSAMFDYHFLAISREIPISGEIDDALWNEIIQADYVVIYLSQLQRISGQRLLEFLEDEQPEYTVLIRDVEYVWVYNMAEIVK